MTSADVAIVIPTRDRRVALERTLRALAHQHFSPSRFEVVVALDGPDQGSAGHLLGLGLPYRVSVVSSDAPHGAASARNQGAAAARGDVLLFLDDDIEADPDLVGAHVRAQREGLHVTIGYLPTAFDDSVRGFFRAALRASWESKFAAMRHTGHRYWFRDLLTGNCAMPAALFARLGGFDAAFSCHEDYEFGVRVIAHGSPMAFVEAARGTHHDRTTLARAFARRRDEGRADVLMLEKHPGIEPSLPLGSFERHANRMQHLLRRLNFERPAVGRLLASALTRTMPALEYARLRGRWMRRLRDVLSYWYWNGVTARLHSAGAFAAFVAECRARSTWSPLTLEVDLGNGLELVMAQIDRRRPAGLRVTLKGETVGEIAPVPGAEGLTGRHLKAALSHEMSAPLLAALGETGTIGLRPLPPDSIRL
jgi:glycosyltransferase involved in cell wall biosynthesis